MIEHFLIVITGIFVGTVSGILPGIGTSISLILTVPILLQLDVTGLFLFYMSILSTAQFTGTIPSVFMQVPGESNSIPALVEGAKFKKRKLSSMAIGICAVGSLFGSIVAICITFLLLPHVMDHFEIFLKDNFRMALYIVVLFASMFAFNNKKYILNFILLAVGYVLAMVGPHFMANSYRLTFGIEALEHGIPFYPLILGLIVAPTMFLALKKDVKLNFVLEKTTRFRTVLFLWFRSKWASLRGAVIGFFAAMCPGFGTLLSTNVSYALEVKLNPLYASRKIIAAETANNSGGFGMLLPFVLLGIPLTSSEFILFNYLLEAGWSPFAFLNLESNAIILMKTLVPWFVFVNFMALIIAWPLAKVIIQIMQKLKKFLNIFIILICVVTCIWLGKSDYQLGLYLTTLIVSSIIAISLKQINLMPVLFAFILGQDLEFILQRYWTLLIN